MTSLVVIKGPDRGKRFELVDPIPTLGRDARNTIRLHDTEASRHHAELRLTPDGFVLHDLQSSNGTYLNGERVDKCPLKPGDRIRIGQSELLFTADQPSQAQSSELASKINMITSQQPTDGSAILRAIKHSEGSQFLRYPERAGSQWLQDALSNLEVMYASSKAISTITDVDQLLDHMIDLVFKSIKADRGCIVLKDVDTGELAPTAVRYAPGIDNEERITLSRTIVDWVIKRNEGVIVLDAAHDWRFSTAQSVVNLGIREAMCVPLSGRHESLGVLYVDIKSDSKQLLATQQPIKFTDDHLKLLIAIAHQAGLAIEDSRFYQAMVQAERLAAVGQTIATLSHHIKNILQGVRAGSYEIEMGINEKNHDLLVHGWSVVQKNQEKIYNLVMDMLSFSKEREPAFEMTDTNALVGDVVELMEPRAKDFGVKLTCKLDDSIPKVAIDPDGIHRAVLNIVTNAIDAVEDVENASVVIETSPSSDGQKLLVTISDNGVGISEDQIAKIFQIFASTKGARGSGLGLAVSQKIAREHGGDIRVTSVLGQGSKFIIELPLRRNLQAGDSGNLEVNLTATNMEMESFLLPE